MKLLDGSLENDGLSKMMVAKLTRLARCRKQSFQSDELSLLRSTMMK